MKLHLPKALFSAIAAALVTPAAYAESYQLSTGDRNQLSDDQVINNTQTLEGDVTVNGRGSYSGHEAGHNLSLGENANVTIDGNLYIVSQCHLKINNGAALTTTGMLSFGHDNSSYPGDLEMTDGQLQVSKIRFHNRNANRVSITGGTLIITGDEAIYDEEGAKLSTLTIGGTGDTFVTLKTGTAHNVTFDYSKLQLGNVTIASDNDKTITITNATLNGAITNEASTDKLQLGDLTIAADTQEVITITNATLNGTITNEAGSDKLILSGNIDLLPGSEYLTISNGDYYSDGTTNVSSSNGYLRANYTANFGTDLTLDSDVNLFAKGYALTPQGDGSYYTTFTDMSTYHVRVGNVDEQALLNAGTVGADTAYFIEGGTLQAAGDISNDRLSYTSGSLSVSTGHKLSIDTGKDDVAALILNTTGAGNIEINIPYVALTGDKAMQITGDLIVKGSSTLELVKSTDPTKETTVDFTSLKSLILDNSTLKANTDDANKKDYRQFTLRTLAVVGESEIAIDGGNPYHGHVTIGNLISGEGTGARTLTLSSNAKVDYRSIFDLNGGDFEGTIKVEQKQNRGGGKTALNLKHGTAASKAVIELDVSSDNGSAALGIAADEVTVKGITGDKKTKTNLYILSGEQAFGGEENFAGDNTDRTLIIDTGDDGHYSTTATLGSNLNLTKKGAGSQTFAGATPTSIGQVQVKDGELAFSNLGNLSIDLLMVESDGKLTLTTNGGAEVSLGFIGGYDEESSLVFNGCGNDASTLNVSSLSYYAGNITVNNARTNGLGTILKLTNTATSDDGEVFNSLTLSNSDTDSNSLGGIVQIHMKDLFQPDAAVTGTRLTTVKSLTVDGLGTIETVHSDPGDDYNATIKINALSGTDAVLNLRSGSQTSNRVVFELGTPAVVQTLAAEETPDAGEPSYTGTINVVANAGTSDEARRVGLVINDDKIAKGTIIELTETSAGTSNQVDLGINADNVTVRGIQTTTDDGSSFSSTIVSGTLGTDNTDAQSDGTERTLTISTQQGDDFTANAAIQGNLNLVKMGEGKQTFSGDMSAFNKAVSVERGELAFTKEAVLKITDLTVKSGATLTIGSPVQTHAADAASAPGVKVTDTVTLEGGSTIDGGGLNLTETKTLTIDNISNNSTITLNGALVLPTGGSITLDGGILTTLAWLGKGSKLNVFTGVTSLMLGSDVHTEALVASPETTDLLKYFSISGLEAGSYSLGYTGAGAGAGGVVYIQKDVPEPTTATLSLLALAALAARRRRKD